MATGTVLRTNLNVVQTAMPAMKATKEFLDPIVGATKTGINSAWAWMKDEWKAAQERIEHKRIVEATLKENLDGPYLRSCSDFDLMHGQGLSNEGQRPNVILTCRCIDGQGRKQQTSIDIYTCDPREGKVITNNNGILVCEQAGYDRDEL